MAKIVFASVLIIHGLIHLMGFAIAFQYGGINRLTQPISKQGGIVWLSSAILFLVAARLYLSAKQYWWLVCLIATGFSQFAIIQSWVDARWGTIANIVIFFPILFSMAKQLPSGFYQQYKKEVARALTGHTTTPILTDTDIASLPEPVKKYLHYTHAVGNPRINNFRAVFKGKMVNKAGGKWMDITAQQYDFFNPAARIFYIQSDMFGIPYDGLHLYREGRATMQIKIGSLVKVVDAKGPQMDRGETVTLFNDMCLLAPATLISPDIQWETIDTLTVKATFTNGNNTISAILYFNQTGELTNFVSADRFQTTDGKTYHNYRWSTPVSNYRIYNGRKVSTYGDAIWHTPQGDFTYARFELKELEYNCERFKRFINQ